MKDLICYSIHFCVTGVQPSWSVWAPGGRFTLFSVHSKLLSSQAVVPGGIQNLSQKTEVTINIFIACIYTQVIVIACRWLFGAPCTFQRLYEWQEPPLKPSFSPSKPNFGWLDQSCLRNKILITACMQIDYRFLILLVRFLCFACWFSYANIKLILTPRSSSCDIPPPSPLPRLLTFTLGLHSIEKIHRSSLCCNDLASGQRPGPLDSLWSFLRLTDTSPREASTIMLGSLAARYTHCIVCMVVLLENLEAGSLVYTKPTRMCVCKQSCDLL